MKRWLGPLLFGAFMAAAAAVGGVMAMPHVLMGIAMDRLATGGINRMSHGDLATPERQPIVRPSPDLAYSACPYDLSRGPLILDISPVPGRYSSLSIFDARTDVILVRNDVQAKGKPYRIALALENQEVPRGVETIRTSHASGIALIRLLLTAPDELPALQADRAKSSCHPLR